jgi:hypothetical protein
MARSPPECYWKGVNAQAKLLEDLEDPETFSKAYKGGNEQCLHSVRILIQELAFNFNPHGTGVDAVDCIMEFHKDLCMALEDNFNISTEHAEMCWKVAMVWFRVSIFNTPHYFNCATEAVLNMAKYCPGVLWRIITLHNVPHGPIWVEVKAERAQKQFRRLMDEAATVDEKSDVIRIKAKLVEFFREQEDLDYPDAEMCEWLGMDSEEE